MFTEKMLIDFGLPVCVCVVLPVLIVLIVFLASMNSENKRAQVLIKAIEANNNIDADKLAEAMKKPQKTQREILNLRLLRGCLFAFVGFALCVVGIISYCSDSGFQTASVTIPLIFGGASLAIGLSYLMVYFVTRNQIKD